MKSPSPLPTSGRTGAAEERVALGRSVAFRAGGRWPDDRESMSSSIWTCTTQARSSCRLARDQDAGGQFMDIFFDNCVADGYAEAGVRARWAEVHLEKRHGGERARRSTQPTPGWKSCPAEPGRRAELRWPIAPAPSSSIGSTRSAPIFHDCGTSFAPAGEAVLRARRRRYVLPSLLSTWCTRSPTKRAVARRLRVMQPAERRSRTQQ